MVLPDANHDPLSRHPGDITAKMIAYIRDHYSHLLGPDVALLDQPGGLDLLHRKYVLGLATPAICVPAAEPVAEPSTEREPALSGV